MDITSKLLQFPLNYFCGGIFLFEYLKISISYITWYYCSLVITQFSYLIFFVWMQLLMVFSPNLAVWLSRFGSQYWCHFLSLFQKTRLCLLPGAVYKLEWHYVFFLLKKCLLDVCGHTVNQFGDHIIDMFTDTVVSFYVL